MNLRNRCRVHETFDSVPEQPETGASVDDEHPEEGLNIPYKLQAQTQANNA